MKDPFSDDIEAQPLTKKLLESDIQDACVGWMRKRGYMARKFSSPANRSVPDYIFFHEIYDVLTTEFKAPGKKSTDAQTKEQELMRVHGCEVWADVDDVENFKRAVVEREWDIENLRHARIKRQHL